MWCPRGQICGRDNQSCTNHKWPNGVCVTGLANWGVESGDRTDPPKLAVVIAAFLEGKGRHSALV